MKKRVTWLLPLVLAVYALLYIATQKKPCENDDCNGYKRVNEALRRNRPFVQSATQCRQAVFCVYVNDSAPQDWADLADTACTVINNIYAQKQSVVIVGLSRGDTLVKQACP